MDTTSPVGWLCVVPPLLTIVLAILSKKVVPSLVTGIASAVVILLPSAGIRQQEVGESFTWVGYALESTTSFAKSFFEEHLWAQLVDGDHLRVFVFTILLGMQVAMIHRMGGMLGIVNWARPFAKTRRSGQILTWFLGLIVFIDDYANTLLLGSTMRPVTDKLKISREKLAFLVDSTAAPVSGLALVSTWIAGELGYIQEGFEAADVEIGNQAFAIFCESIPSRFYVLLALVFVVLVGFLGRDFGPMLRAEKRALQQKPGELGDASESNQPIAASGWNAILPIVTTITGVIALLVLTGMSELGLQELPPFGATLADLQAWGNLVGNGNSYVALVYGALAGLLVCLFLNLLWRTLSVQQIRDTLLEGFLHVLPALIILWLAWTLSGLTDNDFLATGSFLATKVSEYSVSPAVMPTVIFLLSGAIAFATGTSWGTMGIVMPIAIPLIVGMLDPAEVDPRHPILLASISGVLAGAIFGDHCSPISDTTILSSRSSDCDHIAHVRTQMPYALTVGAVTVLCGTLPVGLGLPAWVSILLGVGSVNRNFASLWRKGRRVIRLSRILVDSAES